MSDAIHALLHPRSIVVIGASPNPSKLNGRPFHFLRRDGYAGKLFAVNPKYREIDGIPCYPDVASLPEAPELAIVAVAASRTIETIRALGDLGTPVAVVFSSGFAEIGESGRALERELAAVAKECGVRVCGPNNLGLFNAFDRMPATFSQYADEPLEPGPVAFASQSGALGTGIAALARSRGIRIGYFVTTGNQVDITLMEVLDAVLDDDRISIAAAYLEGVGDADQLVALAAKAIALGKPLVVLKVGRKAAGARAAASHTGSLAGEDAVFDGVARQHGIIRARNEEHLLDLVTALGTGQEPQGRGIAFITQSGGAGVMMADRAEELGLDLPSLDGSTRERLARVIPEFGALGNPVDITGQFLAEPGILTDSVRIVLEDPRVHIAVVWLQLMHRDAALILEVLVELRRSVDKPFIVCWLEPPPGAGAALRDAGVCMLSSTERSVDAAAAMIAFGEARRRLAGRERAHARPAPASHGPPRQVPVMTARERLERAGLDAVACEVAREADEVAAIAARIGFPVALKVESADIAHKLDVGGVRLGLGDAGTACEAAREMLAEVRARAPDASIDGILVQAMAPRATELVLGLRRDPAFGPVVMVGLGGVFVEVLGDVAFARAPLHEDDAAMLLDRLAGRAILDGARGRPPVDRSALAAALCTLARFGVDNPDVVELDLNPVRAGPWGVVAVDWLMVSTAPS